MGSVGSGGEGLQVVDGGGGGGKEDKGKLVGGALGHCKQGISMDGLPFVIRSIAFPSVHVCRGRRGQQIRDSISGWDG